MSDNDITDIPKQLGQMPLVAVDFSRNRLGDTVGSGKWQWLEHEPIRSSLCQLNLSGNKVSTKYLKKKIIP